MKHLKSGRLTSTFATLLVSLALFGISLARAVFQPPSGPSWLPGTACSAPGAVFDGPGSQVGGQCGDADGTNGAGSWCSSCSSTHVALYTYGDSPPSYNESCSVETSLLVSGCPQLAYCYGTGTAHDCYCINYGLLITRSTAHEQLITGLNKDECATMCADYVYKNSACPFQNQQLCCHYEASTQTCELHNSYTTLDQTGFEAFVWDTGYANQPTNEPITAQDGSNEGPEIIINSDFTNVIGNNIYLTKADTFDWIDNPWEECYSPTITVELCKDDQCSSPCVGSGTNDCYGYISAAPNYDLIFDAPQEDQVYYIVAKSSTTTISRKVIVTRITCVVTPGVFPIEMLMPSTEITEISLAKHLAYANNEMMNIDCLLVKTEVSSYEISSTSNPSVYGTGTWNSRASCTDSGHECFKIDRESLNVEDITYQLQFSITYNPTWSSSDSRLQNVQFISLTSIFSVTMGQLDQTKIISSIPLIGSTQILSQATKLSLDPTNRLVFPDYPRLNMTGHQIMNYASSSATNLMDLTLLSQPIPFTAALNQYIDINVSYENAIPTFYLYGGIEETTNYHGHEWLTDIYYTMDQVDVPKFECSDCSEYAIDDSYTALDNDDYDTFELAQISMLSQANIIFTSSDSSYAPREVLYYYKPYDLKLQQDNSLSASNECNSMQSDCYATVDAPVMNLQFWYVPRDNHVLYLRAIAHDLSSFFRKVNATINCEVTPASITQQKLMPSYGIEDVQAGMILQSINSMMSSQCLSQSSILNSTNSTRITQQNTTTCSQTDINCFHADVQEPIQIENLEYDMRFTIDYVLSPYSKYFPATHQSWFTTDLAILSFFTLPSYINVTIGKRDWKMNSMSLGKINRGFEPIPEYLFLINSRPNLEPSNVINFPISVAFTLDKTIYYNTSSSDSNLMTSDKVSPIIFYPLDPNKLRLEINTDFVYEETFYIYSAVKEFDSMGFTSDIYFDITPIILKTKCGNLYYRGELFQECQSFFYSEQPVFAQQEPTDISIDIQKELCSEETRNMIDKYIYKSSMIVDREGDNFDAHCHELTEQAKKFATVRLTGYGYIELIIHKKLMNSLGEDPLSFKVYCRIRDKSGIAFSKQNSEEFKVDVKFQELTEGNSVENPLTKLVGDKGLNLTFYLDSQDKEGNICINTGFTLTKTQLLEDMLATASYQPDNITFVNSQAEEFGDQLIIGKISHKYEIFSTIEGLHEFEWQLTKIEGANLCLQLQFVNPLIVSYYGVDQMRLELDLVGKRGIGLFDLFKFTPIVGRDLEDGKDSADQDDGTVVIEFELNMQESQQMSSINKFFLQAFQGIADASAKGVASQFLINFLLAGSFSKMNSYLMTLQLIVYCCFLLGLWFPENVRFTLKMMLVVCQLDFIPEEYVEWILENVFRLQFNEDNDPPEQLQTMGMGSNNFFLVVGPITIYILIEFGLVLFNEIFLASILRCRMTKKDKSIQEQTGDEVKQDLKDIESAADFVAIEIYEEKVEETSKPEVTKPKEDYIKGLNDRLSRQTLFNGTIQILDSGTLDIVIAIVTCIKSQATDKKMAENGEIAGFIVSLLMIISYIASSWMAYRLINTVSQKSTLFFQMKVENAQSNDEGDGIEVIKPSQDEQVQVDLKVRSRDGKESKNDIAKNIIIEKTIRRLQRNKKNIKENNDEIRKFKAKVIKKQNSSLSSSTEAQKYIQKKKKKMKELRDKGIELSDKRQTLKNKKLSLENQVQKSLPLETDERLIEKDEKDESMEVIDEKIADQIVKEQKALLFQNYEDHMSPKKYSLHSRFGIVIEDLKTHKGAKPLMYKPVWTARRFVILTIGLTNLYAENHLAPIFQIFIVIWANLLHLLYLIVYSPFSDIQNLRIELFNTLIFYILSIFFLFYIKSQNLDEDGIYIVPIAGFYIDTIFKSLFFLFTFVNLLVLVKDQITQIYRACYEKVVKGDYPYIHGRIKWFRGQRFCNIQFIDHPETSSSSEDDSSEVEERMVVKAVKGEIQIEKSRVDELPEEIIEVVEVIEEPIQPKIVKVVQMVQVPKRKAIDRSLQFKLKPAKPLQPALPEKKDQVLTKQQTQRTINDLTKNYMKKQASIKVPPMIEAQKTSIKRFAPDMNKFGSSYTKATIIKQNRTNVMNLLKNKKKAKPSPVTEPVNIEEVDLTVVVEEGSIEHSKSVVSEKEEVVDLEKAEGFLNNVTDQKVLKQLSQLKDDSKVVKL